MNERTSKTIAVREMTDSALRELGYCGRCDDTGRRRCYRRAGHRGPCKFFANFQLMQP